MNKLRTSLALAPLLCLPVLAQAGCSVTTSTPTTDAGPTGPTPTTTATTDAGPTPSGSDAGADAGPTTFVPSNFDPKAIDMALATDVAIAGDEGGCELDTDAPQNFGCGVSGGATPFSVAVKQVPQPNGAPTLLVIGVKSFTLGTGKELSIVGSHPVAIYSLGAVDINGTINAAASGSTEGNGALHDQGLGQPDSSADDSAIGSAGASFCGLGGAGAPVGVDAGAGTTPTKAYGSQSLIPLYAGSSGGNHASTGYGGGALQVTSLISVTVGGEITVNGDGGDSVSGSSANGSTAGGGGGSGGAILLEAPVVTGSGKLFANGGGGGSGDTYGTDGQESAIAAPGAAPSGGAGSGGAVVDGQPGTTVKKANDVTDNGGGGGGAGYIRINTASGVASFNGTASPSLSSKCGTQGTLNH